jgi:hypothetical protein
MTDLDINGFALSCQGKTYRIPFEPPMKSLAEARERVVSIDKDCRKALGHSDVTVKTFEWPQGGGAVAAAITLFTFVAFSQRWWFEPKVRNRCTRFPCFLPSQSSQGIVAQNLGASAAARMYSIQPWLFWILLGVHALESVVLAQTKLKKHSVNPRSGVYWAWIISNTIEGFPCGLRFGRLVKKLEAKQKH